LTCAVELRWRPASTPSTGRSQWWAPPRGPRLFEITHEIWELLIGGIPELRGDELVERLLDASIEENVATLLHMFEHGTAPEDIDAPAAAVAYAKRLAQRRVPIPPLIRAYRVGHGRFLERCLDELAVRSTDAELTGAVTARLIELSFRYIDRVSEQVISTHQRERDRWLPRPPVDRPPTTSRQREGRTASPRSARRPCLRYVVGALSAARSSRDG
jgi:hypothetical protein